MTTTHISPAELPDSIRDFLAAHLARDADAAMRTLTTDPVVVDDGTTFRGDAEVREFLAHAGSEFRYTTELVAAERVDDTHWVAVNRLEGDFPGGVVELAYRFVLENGRIAELVIAP